MKTEVSSEWQQYRQRTRGYWAVCLAYFPFMLLFVAGQMQDSSWHLDQMRIVEVGFLAYGAVCIVVSVRLLAWRCPRCRSLYFVKGARGNPLGKKCANCGLERWSSPDSCAK